MSEQDALVVAVQKAVDTVAQGAYPVEVDSLWVAVTEVEPLRANLLPLLSSATETAEGELVESKAYKSYQRVVVDDSEGCRRTSERLLSLDDGGFETPEEAVPKLVASAVSDGLVSADDKTLFTKVWRLWLHNVRWSQLSGDFVRAHELDMISIKAMAPDPAALADDADADAAAEPSRPLTVSQYSAWHPRHAGFAEAGGAEHDGQAFVQVYPYPEGADLDVATSVGLARDRMPTRPAAAAAAA